MENSLEHIAKMIDHSMLHPRLTDDTLQSGCELAKDLNLAAVTIKPYAVRMAKQILTGSLVKVGSVVGFPHGNSQIDVKVKEAERACEDGADEVDFVVNVGKVLSEDWDYIRNEIETLNSVITSHDAIAKVIFENDFYHRDDFKIELCKLCNDIRVSLVKTSTGFGFVKQKNGMYAYRGATMHDLKLMRKFSLPHIQVQAAGGIRSLDDVLRVKSVGVGRVSATSSQAIIEQAKARDYK